MKYNLTFNKENYKEEIDEYNILLNKNILKIVPGIKFKRLNLEVTAINQDLLDIVFDYYEELKSRTENGIYLKFMISPNLETITKIKEKKIPFFLNTPVTNWESLNLYLDTLGVSDVYIGEDLGFDIQSVKAIAAARNVQVRFYPYVSCFDMGIKTFFIRPEDISYYEDYIDVLDFTNLPISKQNIYYEIYKDKKWYGNLKEIFPALNIDLDSRYIVPLFGKKRVYCQRKCLKGQKCNLCDTIADLSKVLKENNIIVKYNKEEEEEKENG